MAFSVQPHALICCLALVGCGDKLPGDTDGTSTGDASTGPGQSSTSGDAPTTGDASSTSGDPTTGDASSSSAGSTTDGLECSLMEVACAEAGQLGDFEDCGLVLLEDPPSAWQAAHDCALAAANEQRAFKVIFELQGIDSAIARAFVGLTAESYAVEALFFDGDPCGGGGCGPKIDQAFCGEGLVAVDGCVVEPGEMCLSCAAMGEFLTVCEG